MLGLVEMPAAVGVLFGSYRFCALLGSSLLGLRGERLSRKGTRSYSSEGKYICPVGRLCIFWVRNSCDGGRVLQLADLGIQEKSMNQSELRILP